MFFRKSIFAVFSIVLGGVTFLKADYYQPYFFPIGLTGINPAGSGNCPYYDGSEPDPWDWDGGEKREDSLIFALGINCIGGQDAKPDYLVNLNPDSNASNWYNNYLHKVCMEADSDIYIFTSGYFVSYPKVFMCGYDTTINGKDTFIDTVHCDTFEWGRVKTGPSWGNQSTYYLFHSPYRPDLAGYGSMLFTKYIPEYDNCPGGCTSADNIWGCHGSKVYNWETFDGDTLWRTYVADTAVKNWAGRFGGDYSEDIGYIWGYNLLSEDPACYNGASPDGQWQGCWAAVDRVITGHKKNLEGRVTQTPFPDTFGGVTPQRGIRGVEDSLNIDHRMVFAKAVLPIWKHANINVFQYIPDIDVVYAFPHGMVHAHWNYGCDSIFDNWLYGTYAHPEHEQERGGWHDWAVYMQDNGKKYLAYPDQKRRWIATLCLEWQIDSANTTIANARRPCPPEIRCLTYLALSRGAKGVLFHPWTYNYTSLSSTLDPSTITIPSNDYGGKNYNLGLRDQAGYPFGEGGPHSSTHKLNGGCSLEVWDTASDTTYAYLAHWLIPEIKAISDELMQLEWVSAYSLKSTCGKESSCPLDYVHDVTTTDSGYIDLGFFSPYYWQDQGEYLMVVNRDGIRDNQSDSITLYLDFPEGDSLYVIEYGDPDIISYLPKSGDGYFHLGRYFAPGEGKLFRLESQYA